MPVPPQITFRNLLPSPAARARIGEPVDRSGASYEAVAEAVEWATGDAKQLGKQKRELSPAAEAVYDLLVSDPAFLGIEREI